MTRHAHARLCRAALALATSAALAAALSACGGGDDGSSAAATTDPTVAALSGQLSPDTTAAGTTDTVPSTHMAPDAAAASVPDASLMPPS
jgi:hypothetical protein